MKSDRPLRFITLNTWKNDGDYAARVAAMTTGLRLLEPDVVLLQEVFRLADGTMDTARALAGALGLALAYAPARTKLRRWHGQDVESESGLAVLARGRLAGIERVPLPSDEHGGERIALLVNAVLAAGAHVLVGCVHLSHLRDDAARRRQQLETILAHPRWRTPAHMRILGGDFNAPAEASEVRWLGEHHDLVITDVFGVATRRQPTHPMPSRVDRAGRSIDFLFTVTPRGHPSPVVTLAGIALDNPVDGVWASDHAAVVARVECPASFRSSPGHVPV